MIRNWNDNPFSITKSNDLTDDEIESLWVGDTFGASAAGRFRPSSPMAMFVLGGKGSGKSHLMRYYSFPLQTVRYSQSGVDLRDGLKGDGFIGIYCKCGGMDADRFSGKGQSEEVWNSLFPYYFELWVADLTLATLATLVSKAINAEAERSACLRLRELFDRPVDFDSFASLRSEVRRLRHDLDYAVNNAWSGQLDAEILVSRGELFFRLPQIVCDTVSDLSGIRFVYLLDEFENFRVPQQIYINTLIRERYGPTSIKVGSRLYGFRTRRTLSGDELNLQGAEYEELRLDERFRRNPGAYESFSEQLILRRLSETDLGKKGRDELAGLFEEPDLDWRSEFLLSICAPESINRPHFATLRKALLRGMGTHAIPKLIAERDVDHIVERLFAPRHPLLEKLAVLFLYQQMFRRADLVHTSDQLSVWIGEFVRGAPNDRFDEFVKKHKSDMVAQLLRENGRPQVYAGLSSFVGMSEGLPRALITILKNVYDWAAFTQEDPFRKARIELKAQEKGVAEASEWFLDHMLEEGENGRQVRSAIERLSELFRINRFSNKPVETSLVAFSVDELQLNEAAQRVVKLARNTSLLVEVPRGQRERNSEKVTSKLELNRMLSPRWDLPIARRGVVSLSTVDANAIFDIEARDQFDRLKSEWQAKMTAPFFGRSDGTQSMPGLF